MKGEGKGKKGDLVQGTFL